MLGHVSGKPNHLIKDSDTIALEVVELAVERVEKA